MGVQELETLEDVWGIEGRKKVYSRELLIEKLSIPAPAKALVMDGVRQTPSGGRRAPSKFTFKQEYTDGAGHDWTYAPYTCEAWKAATDESQEDAAMVTRNVLLEGDPREGHEEQAATARSEQLRSAGGDFVLSPCLG